MVSSSRLSRGLSAFTGLSREDGKAIFAEGHKDVVSAREHVDLTIKSKPIAYTPVVDLCQQFPNILANATCVKFNLTVERCGER